MAISLDYTPPLFWIHILCVGSKCHSKNKTTTTSVKNREKRLYKTQLNLSLNQSHHWMGLCHQHHRQQYVYLPHQYTFSWSSGLESTEGRSSDTMSSSVPSSALKILYTLKDLINVSGLIEYQAFYTQLIASCRLGCFKFPDFDLGRSCLSILSHVVFKWFVYAFVHMLHNWSASSWNYWDFRIVLFILMAMLMLSSVWYDL